MLPDKKCLKIDMQNDAFANTRDRAIVFRERTDKSLQTQISALNPCVHPASDPTT